MESTVWFIPLNPDKTARHDNETRPGVTAFASDLPHFILEEIDATSIGRSE